MSETIGTAYDDSMLPENDLGTGLDPGDHLIEFELKNQATSTPRALEVGMLRLGFSKVFVDTAPRQETIRGSLRFLAQLRQRKITLRDTPLIRWTNFRCLTVDLSRPLRFTLEPFELKPETLYEVRFLSRPVRRK